MILFPAIDLKNGQCVRLVHGEMERTTVFNDDPGAQAKSFEQQGFEWIHLVDLNGAFAGKPINGSAVENILRNITIPAQLGGGIRDLATIEDWLSRGLSRLILGTVALRDPELVKEACRKFPGKIAVGIDARGGYVAVEGWAKVSDMPTLELAKKFEDAGAAAIIYTDIDRDGAMQGMNVAGTTELANAISTPVIASGGVTNLDDLKALKQAPTDNIMGVISGRAIYDGRLDIVQSLTILAD
jgi:phosphoribosylformimino-5-aminoimidazole carboxamide ribotide isomerase